MKFKLIAAIAATTLFSSMSMAKAAIAVTLTEPGNFSHRLFDDSAWNTANAATQPSMGTSTGEHSEIGQAEEMAKKKKKTKKKKTTAS